MLFSISEDFGCFDLNEDGVLTRELVFKEDIIVDGIFERLDKNKDGVISYAGMLTHLSFSLVLYN